MLYIKANSVVSSALESAFTSSVSATVEDTHDYSYLDAIQACHESALEAQMAMYDMVHFDVEMSTKSVEAYTEAGGNTELLESYMRPVYEGFFAEMWGKIKNFFKKIVDAVIKALSSAWNFLKGLYQKAKTKIQEWFKKKDNAEKKAEGGSSTAAAASSDAAASSAPSSTSSEPAAASSAPVSNKVVKPGIMNTAAKSLVSFAKEFEDSFGESMKGFAANKKNPLAYSHKFPAILADDEVTVDEKTGEFKCKDAKSIAARIRSAETNVIEITDGVVSKYFDEYSKAEAIQGLAAAINSLRKKSKEYEQKSEEMSRRGEVTKVTAQTNKPGGEPEFLEGKSDRQDTINYNTKFYTSYAKVIITVAQMVQTLAAEACAAVLRFITNKDKNYAAASRGASNRGIIRGAATAKATK